MAFKILLTENHSALGEALFKGFENQPLTLIVPDFPAEQWADEGFVASYLQDVRPAVIVSTLVYATDARSSRPLGSMVLPRVCAKLDLTIINLSTHLVFAANQHDGEVLSEHDTPKPDTDWGAYVLEVEQTVASVPRSITLRIPWVLDTDNGIIFQAANCLLDQEIITLSEAWRGTPVFSEDVVRAVITIVQQILCGAENWGVFHFHSSDSCSEAEFLDYIARILYRKGCAIGSTSVTTAADRLFEGNGWLVGNRCTNCFGIQFRSWRQGAKGCLEYWLDKKFAEGVIQLQERKFLAAGDSGGSGSKS